MYQMFIDAYGEPEQNDKNQDGYKGYDLEQVYVRVDGNHHVYYSGEWKKGQFHGKGK